MAAKFQLNRLRGTSSKSTVKFWTKETSEHTEQIIINIPIYVCNNIRSRGFLIFSLTLIIGNSRLYYTRRITSFDGTSFTCITDQVSNEVLKI